MPELPEVQTIVTQLSNKVLKRTFVDIWTDAPKLFKHPAFWQFKKELLGKKILKITRLGKNILFWLSGDKIMLAHMKMTGHLLWGQWTFQKDKWQASQKGPLLSDWPNQFIHVMFFLDKKYMLALTDIRKFAKLEIFGTKDLPLKKELLLGPDPLAKDLTFEKFRQAIFKKPKGKIKQVLMDQNIIAGIGNIYSDEILWEAKVHPFTRVSQISPKSLHEIYKKMRLVLAKGVKLRGESFSDYRDLYGEKGDFDRERKAYKRDNRPCFRCHTLLKSRKIGGRTARYCPKCQKEKA